MKFLVLQHLAVEHPGIFRDFWVAAGVSWDAVELDEGEAIPSNLAGYDALVAMGGPMDVWEEEKYPWLKAEKAVIRDWVVGQEKPFLGICLGHQLLAEAIGGNVGRMGIRGIRASYSSPTISVSISPGAKYEALIPRIPMHRWGRPAEVASAVYQLCTPDFGYVTGTEIFVTGGQHLY